MYQIKQARTSSQNSRDERQKLQMAFEFMLDRPFVLSNQIWNALSDRFRFEMSLSDIQHNIKPVPIQIKEAEQFFHMITSWNIKQLIIGGNAQSDIIFPTLMKSIEDISFYRLQFVNFWRCNIESIQNISRIQFPYLQTLWLDENMIISLRGLARLNTLKLKTLSIRKNRIVGLDSLLYANLYCLQQLIVQYWREDPEIVCDLSWISKLPSKNLKQMHFESNQRIYQMARIKKMIQKFPEAELNTGND